MKKGLLFPGIAVTALLGMLLFVSVSCERGHTADDERTPLKGKNSMSDGMPEPPGQDGKLLYEFLLKEAPELMAQIPCSCCGHNLDWCYRGGCPYT